MSMRSKFLGVLAISATAVFLVACGGGGGGGTATTTTTISGSAVKGPVSGATVTVRNAATGAVLGTTTTGAGGLYSIDISFTGDVLIEVSGGTYTDEATGLATPLSTPLRVVLNANGGAVTGIATPLTTMAYTYALGSGSSVSASAFNTAATTLANQFQLTGVNLATTTPVVSGSLNGYGRVLSAISRYLQLNGATLQSLVGVTFNTTQWADFSAAFSTAYAAANPGSNISFSFDGSAFTIGGTGAGGGSGGGRRRGGGGACGCRRRNADEGADRHREAHKQSQGAPATPHGRVVAERDFTNRAGHGTSIGILRNPGGEP